MGIVVGGVGQQTQEIGLGGVGDPHLGAVNDVVVAVFACGGFDGCHIGAGAGLAHGNRGHHVARNGGRKKLLAQLVAAKFGEGRGGHIRLHADAHGHAAALNSAHLFCEDNIVAVVQAHAAVGFRFGDAEQAQVTHLFEQFMGGKNTFLFPFADVGVDFALYEASGRAANFIVFLGEAHVDLPI